jgi:hypothetical protein
MPYFVFYITPQLSARGQWAVGRGVGAYFMVAPYHDR